MGEAPWGAGDEPNDAPFGAGEGLADAGDQPANPLIPPPAPRGERRVRTRGGIGDSAGIGCARQRTGDS